jgi:hypothetical protein
MLTSSQPQRLSELRSYIGARVDALDLPLAGEQKLFAGYGRDEICEGCGKPIGSTDVLYEVELNPSLAVAMHLTCFEVWIDVSRQRRTGAIGGGCECSRIST